MQQLYSLYIRQPFDLAPSLLSGQSHRWRKDKCPWVGEGQSPPHPELARELDEEWLWGVISGHLFKIRQAEDEAVEANHHSPLPEGVSLVEYSASPEADPAYLESLLRDYLRLNDDIEAIYEDITRDPRVEVMVRRYWGLRLLRIEPWECLVSFICSANSNLARIHANMEAMAENFGSPLALDCACGNRHVSHSFPPPELLAEAGEAALRALGLGFRAPYVAKTAVIVADGGLDLEALRLMPYPEAKERLMELPGVGPKIADCVLLHSLDKLESFPIDVWVRRALRDWYFSPTEEGQKPPPDRAMLEWALQHFGPYAGYAELYLFHGRRLGKEE